MLSGAGHASLQSWHRTLESSPRMHDHKFKFKATEENRRMYVVFESKSRLFKSCNVANLMSELNLIVTACEAQVCTSKLDPFQTECAMSIV